MLCLSQMPGIKSGLFHVVEPKVSEVKRSYQIRTHHDDLPDSNVASQGISTNQRAGTLNQPLFLLSRNRDRVKVQLNNASLKETVQAFADLFQLSLIMRGEITSETKLFCHQECSPEQCLELLQFFLHQEKCELEMNQRVMVVKSRAEPRVNRSFIQQASYQQQQVALNPQPTMLAVNQPVLDDNSIPGMDDDDSSLPWIDDDKPGTTLNGRNSERQVDPLQELLEPESSAIVPPAMNRSPSVIPAMPEDRSSETFLNLPPVDLQEHDFTEISYGVLTFNFRNAPWDVVLEKFADVFGYSLRTQSLPEGDFNYIDQKPYTIAQAIDIVNSHLIYQDHLVIRHGQSLVVLDLSDGLPASIIPVIQAEEITHRGLYELFTVPLVLDQGNAEPLALKIESLLGPVGNVTVMPSSNTLVVTDFGANVRRIEQMIQLENAAYSRITSRVIPLKNSPAEEVVTAINEFLIGRSGVEGSLEGSRLESADQSIVVAAEISTNSVLLRGSHRLIEEILLVIRKLDESPKEVLIQALLVEVELGNTSEFGVELGIQDSVLFNRSVVDTLVTLTETVTQPVTGVQTTNDRIISQTQTPGFNFNNQPLGNNAAGSPSAVGSQGLSNFALGRVNGELGYGGLVLSGSSNSVSILLRALAANFNVDILSRPQIRTIDNNEATIQIGQQVPVVDGVSVNAVGSANPVIRQEQAGIILKVKPHIHWDGTVSIQATAEKSQFNTAPGSGVVIFTDATNGNVIEAPIKDLTTAQTTVKVKTGQTIVLGGMITEETTSFERKVPFVGDLPVLGRLFRYDNSGTRRKELLIFLSPHIIDDCHPHETTATEIDRMSFPHEAVQQMHGNILPVSHEVLESDLFQPEGAFSSALPEDYYEENLPPEFVQPFSEQIQPLPGYSAQPGIQNIPVNPYLDPTMLNR